MASLYAGRWGIQQFVQALTGVPQTNLAVTVYLVGTTTPATLYNNRTKSATVANPFLTDALGNGGFYADPGLYDIWANGSLMGTIEVNEDPAETADLARADVFVAETAGSVPITIKGAAGQTANLTEWQNSAGALLAAMDEAGRLGLGADATASRMLFLGGTHPNTGTTTRGFGAEYTAPATTTSESTPLYGAVKTAASAFTMARGIGLYIDVPTVGAGSTITDLRGIRVLNQGAAGVTNAYGVWIESQAGAATNNLPLVIASTSTFSVNSSGQVGLNGAISSGALVIANTGTHPSSAVNITGFDCRFTAPATATTSAYWFMALMRLTAGGSYSTLAALRVDVPVPSTATATNVNGVQIVNQGFANATNAYGINISGQSGASTLNVGVRVDSGATAALWLGAGGALTDVTGGITFGSGRDVTIFRSAAGVLNLNGNMRVDTSGRTSFGTGASPLTDRYFDIGGSINHPGTGTTVRGLVVDFAVPATATNTMQGYYARFRTAAASFTLGSAYVYYADTPSIGAGSTVTNAYGVRIENQGASGVTNAFGLFVAQQTGAGTNLALVVNTSTTWSVDSQGRMGINSGIAATRLIYAGASAHPNAGVSVYGVHVEPQIPATATTLYAGYTATIRTAASAFTVGSALGFQVESPVIGAGSTITDLRGVFVANQGTSGVTNAYGVWISSQSGATTNNFPLVITAVSTFAVRSDGRVMLGTSSDNSGFINNDVSSHPGTGTAIRGAIFRYAAPSTATLENTVFYSEVRTAAASFTQTNAYNFRAVAPTVGAGSTISNLYGVFVANQGASGVTNAYGVWIAAQSGAATDNLPLVVGSTSIWSVNSSGQMGVGSAVTSQYMVSLSGTHPGTQTNVYGVVSDVQYAATGTGAHRGVYSRIRTAASAYTTTEASAFFAAGPTIGAGSTITNAYGLNVANLGGSGVTNAYGVFIAAQSGAATDNLALVVGSTSTFAVGASGRMGVGGSVQANSLLNVSENVAHSGTGTSIWGIAADYIAPSTSTTASTQFYGKARTAASSFTQVDSRVFQADVPSLGASSAITNLYGLRVENQGAGAVTNAYGTMIAAQSGAATLNVGARIDTATTAALWLGGDTTSTTVAGGIAFGSGRDVTWFRSSGTTIKSNAALVTARNTAPADADIATSDMSIWFDNTNGASKLMVKAKQADGTVKTASLALA